MYNFKNPVFSKLYRYYCAKLLKKIWVSVLWFLYALFILAVSLKSVGEFFERTDSWQKKLTIFWVVSLLQLFFLWLMIHPLIAYLVGRDSGWGNLRKGRLFQMPGISQQEDVKVLLFTPAVDRKTVIYAKFATAFTYFMAINFFLCSVLAVYFLAATKLGVLAALSFLLLNGLLFSLVNFCFVVPFLFYQQQGGSWLVYIFIFAFFFFLVLILSFLREFISQYPLVFCLTSIPLLVLTGYFFFRLYRKKFLTQDLG